MSFTNNVVEYGATYENTITVNDGYSLKSISISVGGVDVTDTAWNPETNTINIDYVTGNIMISGVTLRGCSVSYTLPNCTSSIDIAEVEEQQSYTTIIKANEGYNISNIQVLMGGSDISSTVVSNINNEYIINISSVTDDIQIIVSTSIITFTVSEGVYDGVNLTYEHTVFYNGTATINIEVLENYEIRENKIVVTENGVERTFTYTDGVLTIDNVKGDIVFNIDCAATYSITYIFNNVTSSNTAATITDQDTYVSTLSFSGTRFNSIEVTITMGSEDITSSSYDLTTKTITIVNPTGNITIHGEAVSAIIKNYCDIVDLSTYNWKFNKIRNVSTEEFGTDYVSSTYDDSTWLDINVPHDWSIYNSFNISQTGSEYESGWLSGGDAVYRVKFSITAEQLANKTYLYFDGVYMTSEVFVNGVSVGSNKNGYSPFDFDISSQLVEGENVLAVTVSNHLPSSRWYSGSGIFRKCYLYNVNVPELGVEDMVITTPNLATEKGGNVTTHVNFKIENVTDSDITLKEVTAYIYQEWDNVKVGETSLTNVTLTANTINEISIDVPVSNPTLWTTHDKTDNVRTYICKTKIKYDNGAGNDYIIYSCNTEFGYRYISWDANGFYLNGEKTFLKGTCNHHDNGPLGAETNTSATERKLRILKDMGCNTIRCTHAPESAVFVNMAMKMGFMLIEELFDGWRYAKNGNSYDYARFFAASDYYKEIVIKNTIRRDKNNPAVIMWSLGNEVAEGCSTGMTEQYYEDAQLLNTFVKKYDTTRPTTIGNNQITNSIAMKIMALVDIPGVNYANDSELSSLRSATSEGVAFSNKCIYGSETSSPFYTRGIYETSSSNKYFTCFDYSNSEHSNAHTSWGESACVALRRFTETYPWAAGEMPWTGFDYIGEPTPVNNSTVRSSFFGIIDLCGFPKDVYYMYQSKWTNKPMIHIVPEDWTIWSSGANVTVWVYSNCPVVKLHMNGVEQTPQLTPATGSHYAYEYIVTYAKGTLVATGYDESRNTIAQDVRFSSNSPSILQLKPDKTQVATDGSLIYVELNVCDNNGIICPRATNEIQFTCTGGKVIATDNGFPACFEDMRNATQTSFTGKCLAIIKPDGTSSSVTVTATDTSNSNMTIDTVVAQGDYNIYADYSNSNYFDPENPPYYIDIIDFELSSYDVELENGGVARLTVTKNPENSTSLITVKSNKEGISVYANNNDNSVTITPTMDDVAGTIVVTIGNISKIVNVKIGAGLFSDPKLYIDGTLTENTVNLYKYQYQKFSVRIEGRELDTIESVDTSIFTIDENTGLMYRVETGASQLKIVTADGSEFFFDIHVSEWVLESDGTTKIYNNLVTSTYCSDMSQDTSITPGDTKNVTLGISTTGLNNYVILEFPVEMTLTDRTNLITEFGYDSTGTKKSYIAKYTNSGCSIGFTQTVQGIFYINWRSKRQMFQYGYRIGEIACTEILLDSDIINIISDNTNNVKIGYTLLPEGCTQIPSFESENGICVCKNGSLYANYQGVDMITITCGTVSTTLQVNVTGITEDGTMNCFEVPINRESMYYIGDSSGIAWSSTHHMYAELELSSLNGGSNILSFGTDINRWAGDGKHYHLYWPMLPNNRNGTITDTTQLCICCNFNGGYLKTYGVANVIVEGDKNLLRIAQGPNGLWINGNKVSSITGIRSEFSTIQNLSTVQIGSLEGANRFIGTVNEIRIIPKSSLADDYSTNGLSSDDLRDLSLNGMNKYRYLAAWSNQTPSNELTNEDASEFTVPMTLSDLAGISVGDSINVVIANPHISNGYVIGYENGATTGLSSGFANYEELHTSVDNVLVDENSSSIYKFTLTKTNTNTCTIALSNGYGPTGETDVLSWSTTLIDYTISDTTTTAISSITSLIPDYKEKYLIRLANPSGYWLNAQGIASSAKFAQTDNEWSVWYIFKCLK